MLASKMIYCRITPNGLITRDGEGSSAVSLMWYSLEHDMSPTQVRAWVQALRSGEYKQVEGDLYGPSENSTWSELQDQWTGGHMGHCCLGVLGSICGISNNDLARDSLLQESYAKIAGMFTEEEPNGHLLHPIGSEERPRILQDLLSGMNDDGWSFDRIADWIEENLIDDDDEIRI